MSTEDKLIIAPKINADTPLAFQQHPQLSQMIDVLIRKDAHHLFLRSHFSSRLYPAFLQALLQQIQDEAISCHIRQASLYYFDLIALSQSKSSLQSLENDLENLHAALLHSEHYYILALRLEQQDHLLEKAIKHFLHHPRCRIIIFDTKERPLVNWPFQNQFSAFMLHTPKEQDFLALIKQQSQALEAYHHVLIPEETQMQSFVLAERYLSATDPLENSLLLLDSSAARASVHEHTDHQNPFTPVVTPAILFQVLSKWTHIPANHLALSHFSPGEFSLALQQRVYGQDIAITCISRQIQQAHADVRTKTGPFASLLFAGPAYTGKKTSAMMMSQKLFDHQDALFIVQLSGSQTSFMDAQCQRQSNREFLSLKDIIRQVPYAILFFENIEQASPSTLDALAEICSTGMLYDHSGQCYHFQQSIILLSTNIGSQYLSSISKQSAMDDDTQQLDLMQLIMNQQKQNTNNDSPAYTADELIDILLPDLSEKLPALLLQHLSIVPFLLLNKASLEKIIRLKMKSLGQQLAERFAIELGYAPEVIRYLAEAAIKHQLVDQQANHIEYALKQLYLSIEQTILTQEGRSNRPQQLFLQLNETGQALRCHWLNAGASHTG